MAPFDVLQDVARSIHRAIIHNNNLAGYARRQNTVKTFTKSRPLVKDRHHDGDIHGIHTPCSRIDRVEDGVADPPPGAPSFTTLSQWLRYSSKYPCVICVGWKPPCSMTYGSQRARGKVLCSAISIALTKYTFAIPRNRVCAILVGVVRTNLPPAAALFSPRSEGPPDE